MSALFIFLNKTGKYKELWKEQFILRTNKSKSIG
jgi:hypothetical protein